MMKNIIIVNSFSIVFLLLQSRLEGRLQNDLVDLEKNDGVLAKHKNKRYYKAKVIQVHRNRMYEVDFDDGSFSDDLLPEDISVGFLKFIMVLLKN